MVGGGAAVGCSAFKTHWVSTGLGRALARRWDLFVPWCDTGDIAGGELA